MKIAIFMDHNTFVRNFIRTGAFDALMKAHDVVFGFASNMPNRLNPDFSTLGLGDRVRPLAFDLERSLVWSKLHLSAWEFKEGASPFQKVDCS